MNKHLPVFLSCVNRLVLGAALLLGINSTALAQATVTLSINPDTVTEGDSNVLMRITATLDAAQSEYVEVAVMMRSDTARSGTDYNNDRNRQLVAIPAGDLSGSNTFTMWVSEDDAVEGDEFMRVDGSVSSDSTFTDFTVVGTRVTIEDVPPEGVPTTVALSVNVESVAEGTVTDITVTATLDEAPTNTPLTIPITVGGGGGTAMRPAVYAFSGLSSPSITVPTGQTTGTRQFILAVRRDSDDSEGDETVLITTTAAGLTATNAQITITDVPVIPVTLGVAPNRVTEGDGATTIRVTATLASALPAGVEALIVPVLVRPGTATAGVGNDYTVSSTSFSIWVGAGSDSGASDFVLTPLGDADGTEGDETVNIIGDNLPGGRIAAAQVTIADGPVVQPEAPTPPNVTLRATPGTVTEGQSNVEIRVTATLDVVQSERVELMITVRGGTATAGVDYTHTGVNNFVILPGDNSNDVAFRITARADDDATEGPETVDIIGAAAPGSALQDFTVANTQITIVDDATAAPEPTPPPTPTSVTLGVNPSQVTEGAVATTITVTATLDAAAVEAVTVPVTVGGGTATAGAGNDYTVSANRFDITIGAGDAAGAGAFDLTTRADGETEADETINVSGAVSGLQVSGATITILGDNTITLGLGRESVTEGATEDLAVTASLAPGVTRMVDTMVTVTVGAGSAAAGADYATDQASFPITIPAMENSATVMFTFSALTDNREESDETVHLSGASREAGVSVIGATVLIRDLAQPVRWNEVNETLLPELARAMGAGARNAVTECIDEAMDGGGTRNAGRSTASLAMFGIRALAGDGDAGRRGALGAASMALSMDDDGKDKGQAAGVTLCAGGEYRDLADESGRDPVDWDGFVRSVHGGGNIALRENLVVGATLSWFDGRFDYVDGRGRGRESQHKTHMLGIHPYLGWSWAENARLWAMAGYSWGETAIEDFSAGALLRSESDSAMSSVAAGGSVRVVDQGERRAAFDLKAETWANWMKLDGNERIEEADVEATGGRLAVEGSYEFALANYGMLRSELELGGRYDGGDGATGFGLETLGGLRYAQGRVRLIMRGRTMLAHEGDRHDWGVHGTLALDSCASGIGWSASLGTDYGALGDNAVQLWDSGRRGTTAAQVANPGLRTRAEAGYGIGIRQGLLTPYGALDLGRNGGHAYSMGARARLGSSLFLHFKGERREYADSAADHRLWLDLEVPLSGRILR